MLYSMSEIRKLYNQAKYQRGRYYDFDIEAIMNELRKDEFYDKFPDDQLIEYAIEKGLKETDTRTENIVADLKKDERFKNFTEDQLYEYAYGIQSKKSVAIHAATMHGYFDHSRPNDPLWNQYTYDEILGMAEEGVVVPDEVLSWAYAMQDANSADYQIENNATDDVSTVENLDGETKTPSQASAQKRSQAFSSKSEVQQELLENKVNETNTKIQQLTDSQEGFVSTQRKAIEEQESLIQEWNRLDAKAREGSISSTEMTRYKEISGKIAGNNTDFSQQLNSLNSELQDLLSDMDNISVLIDINEKLGRELEDSSISMAAYEGSKKRGYLGTKKETGIAGSTDTMRAQAIGGDIAVGSAIKGTQLNSATNDIKNIFTLNANHTEQITQQVDFAKTLSQANPLNISVVQPETPADEENNITPEDVEQTEETNVEDSPVITPEKPAEETEEPSDANPQEAIGETENSPEITAQEPAAQTESLAAVKTQEPNPETIRTTAVTEPEPVTETVEPSNVEDSEPAADLQEPAEVTSDAIQDTAVQAVQSAVNNCIEQQSQIELANSEVVNFTQQVNELRDNKFIDDMKLNVTLEANLKEYQQLAEKVQSGSEFSNADIVRINQLEAFLDTNNGEFVNTLQAKLNTLNAYGAAVENLSSLADNGRIYGQQAVEQGKAYAESEMGDKTEMKHKSNYILLSKEKRYDLLYGKSGESIGRDLIDSGESLINASVKTLAVQNNIINKAVSNFVAQYSENINGRITGAAAAFAPLKTVVSTAIAQQAAKQAQEEQTLDMNLAENENQEQTRLSINNYAVSEVVEPAETEQPQTVDETEPPQNSQETPEPEISPEPINTLNSTAVQDNAVNNVGFNNEKNIQPANAETEQGEENVQPVVEQDNEPEPIEDNEETEIIETVDEEDLTPDAVVLDTIVEDVEPEQPDTDDNVEVVDDENDIDDSVDPEYADIVDEEIEPLPVKISENSSENDIQSVIVDDMYAESEENANLLNNFGAKLSFEKLAKEAAKTALDESMTKGGFHASGSVNSAASRAAGSDNKKSETSRTRRFLSYEDKNRRAALADRVENGKKVVMKRGKKKNS